MKLADWLYYESTCTPRDLRLTLGVSKSAMSLYLASKRTPRDDVLTKITIITKGNVTRADFEHPDPPRCAEVHIRKDGSTRWVFPWSTGKPQRGVLYSSRVSSPLLRAIEVLHGRARLTPRGVYLLDGRVSDPKRIVRAANERLRSLGQEPIQYPTVEPIHD